MTLCALPCQVHQHPRLAEERYLAVAVHRYERCWLPLLAAHAEKCASAAGHADAQGHDSSRSAAGISPPAAAEAAAAAAAATTGNGMTAVSEAAAALATSAYSGQLAAPLDVAWVWWAHSIAPAAYRQVCSAHMLLHFVCLSRRRHPNAELMLSHLRHQLLPDHSSTVCALHI
jgi:hypothetical protein